MLRRISIVGSLAAMLTVTIVVRSDEDSSKKVESPARKEAREHMSEFTVQSAAKGRDGLIEILPNPLLTFGDAARSAEAGTLWAWGKSGRPVAFLELYRNFGNDQPWVHALTLTSPELIQLTGPNNQRWTPKKSHFVLKDVPNSPEVSAQPAIRLRQMKEISRRFEAHQFWDPDNSRFEMRLLVQPVHRYHDEASKLIDGAVFVMAHGTNPEVLVQIEAHVAEKTSTWKYSVVRLGSAEMHVLLDGKEVWTEPRTPGIVGQPVDPYWLFLT
ncbi:MAG: hypothetical protein IAG10_10975, partial [Planctomycetaceae bacterium]|nr:hypothetical protein [Planctomycetaceae bacterium]